MQGVLTFAIALLRFGNPPGFQLPKWELTWECESSFSHTLTFLWAHTLANLYLGHKPEARVVTLLLKVYKQYLKVYSPIIGHPSLPSH